VGVTRGGRILRPTLHFVASVLMCSGVLLLMDAGLTLAWQEPVSAFMAGREQAALGNELDGLNKAAEADKRQFATLESLADPKKQLARLARLQSRRDSKGDAVGRLRMPDLGRSYVIVEGTDLATLRKGPGHYPKTPLPGQGGTVAIAGHRTTYGAPFRTVDKLKRGDELIMDMPYGRFTYRVDKVQIVKPNAIWITRKRTREQLVLSACHPLYSAAERIIVFSTLTKSEAK
jgi:sortase A